MVQINKILYKSFSKVNYEQFYMKKWNSRERERGKVTCPNSVGSETLTQDFPIQQRIKLKIKCFRLTKCCVIII